MLYILVQYVKLSLEYEGYEKTSILFDRIVSCATLEELFENTPLKKVPMNQTFVFQILSPENFTTLWLLYCHLRYFNDLPYEGFQCFPYDYIIKPEYFVICWNVKNQKSCLKTVKTFLLRSMTNLLKLFKEASCLQHFHLALVKNMVDFQKHMVGHYDKFLHDYVDSLTAKFENNPELYLIKSEIDVILQPL